MTQGSATQQRSDQASDKTAIHPFHVNVPETELTELRRRINATKWPERETVTDASQGVQLATIQALARYWATDYEWRKVAIGARSSPNKWVCWRLRSCSAFTSTCLACFRTRLTTRLFPGRRRHRVSQPTKNSLTSVCSSYIRRVSDTGSNWDFARRPCTQSRIHRSAWRLI